MLHACIVRMFCGKRKTVSLRKLECDCVACMYSVYTFCAQGKTKCQYVSVNVLYMCTVYMFPGKRKVQVPACKCQCRHMCV